MEKKGVLSRQIGEAKREGKPIDGLLVEMKQVSAEISLLKKEQKENLEYQFTVTSIVKTPEEFFALFDKLSGELRSVYIAFPIVFSKLNEGIEVKYIITLYQAPKESPKPKS